jgi:DNA-binding response OmpR family regulator
MSAKSTVQDREDGSGPLPSQEFRPHRILVVDDDETIRNLNAEALSRAGFHVDAAEDGADAWETLQKLRYDLVVTDNKMPRVTGLELIEKIHAADMTLPVIVVTGTFPEDDLARDPGLAPAAILLKPYRMDALLGTVKTLLQFTAAMVAVFWFLAQSASAQQPRPVQEKSFQSPAAVDINPRP